MRIRFSVILPVLGLLVFAAVTYRSMAANPEAQNVPNKYYRWSSLRLDTDPLNKNPQQTSRCESKNENCSGWQQQRDVWVTPGFLDRALIFSALPAFLAGTGLVIAFSTQGVDEVLTFMVSMPIFLFLWYYLVGRLVDRLIARCIARHSLPTI